MLSLVGAAVIVASALLIVRAYAAYLKRSEGACQGFIDFLKMMRGRISCYLEPMDVWVADFRCDSLEVGGFLRELRGGARLSDAFESSRQAYYLPADVEEALTEYFSSSGSGYIDGELRALESCLARLEEGVGAHQARNEKNKKAVTAVTLAVAMGLVLLML